MKKAHQYRLDEINAMDRETFILVFGNVFEDSAWVASKAWMQQPFCSVESLVNVLCQFVRDADDATQLALLHAHPELGTSNKMTDNSAGEQTVAGIRHGTNERQATLDELNQAYRKNFDFPFIVAVKGMTMKMILESLQSRLNNDRETEFKECLNQVFRIALFRLDDLLVKD